MKKSIFFIILLTLLFLPLSTLQAQTTTDDSNAPFTFDRSTVPQWAKDLRRFDIVAFGTFPITIMFTTMIYDNYLNYNSVGLTGDKTSNILLMAAGASVTLAVVDLVIVLIKRNRGKQRRINVEDGFYEIEIIPYGEPEVEDVPAE